VILGGVSEEAPPEEPKEPKLRSVPGGKRPASKPTSFETYERCATTYFAGNRTVKGLMRAMREQGFPITEKTAKKAIKEGWPQHKWPPLDERAALHDKLHQQASMSTDSGRASAAKGFLKMRDDYLTIAGGVRAGIAKAVTVIMQNVDRAVATTTRPTRQVHVEEVLDAKGRVVRRIPKTLTVDAQFAPSIFDVAQALNQLAAALERTGGGELGQLLADVPDEAAGKGKHKVTIEQIQYMADHGGALPPGVTPEMLGGD